MRSTWYTEDKPKPRAQSDDIWFVKSLIAANAVTFVLVALADITAISTYLSFDLHSIRLYPWTPLTYPLVAGSHILEIISVAAGCYWLWMAGGTLERRWGTKSFGIYFSAMSLVSVLGLALGGFISGKNVMAQGLWLPLAGLSVAYGAVYASNEIRFLFFIPMKAKHLIPITVVLCFIAYTHTNIVVAFCSLAGCAFSGFYCRRFADVGYGGYGSSRNTVRLFPRRGLVNMLNPWKWYTEVRDRKRLKRLFDKSDYR